MAFGDLRGTLVGGAVAIPSGGAMASAGSVANVAIGDLIVAMVAENGANTVTSVTDNLNTPTTYTALNAGTLSSVGGRLFYFISTHAGTLTSVTGTGTASNNDFAIAAAVFQGPFPSTNFRDVAPSNVTDTTSPFTAPASGTLAQPSELVIAGFALTRGQTNTAATSPNLLACNAPSSTANAANSCSAAIGYQVVSSTGTISPAFTCASGTFNGGVLCTTSFKNNVQALSETTLFDDGGTDSFPAPTVTLRNQPLTQTALFDDASGDGFPAAKINLALVESALFNDAASDSFPAPTVVGKYALTAPRIDDSTDAFPAPTVAVPIALTAPLLSDPAAFIENEIVAGSGLSIIAKGHTWSFSGETATGGYKILVDGVWDGVAAGLLIGVSGGEVYVQTDGSW